MDLNIYGEIFSKIYDHYWTDYIDEIAEEILTYYKKNVGNGKILDLCCGTGRLSNYLLINKHVVIGLDQSEFMLHIARKKNYKFDQFSTILSDARDFQLDTHVSLVISTFDSLNHVDSIDDLEQVFSRVYDALTKDGYFLFDLNTEKTLREWDFLDIDETEDITILSYGAYSNKERRAYTKVSGFYKMKGKSCFQRFEEIMYNTIFDIDQVAKKLESIGFADIKYYQPSDLKNEVSDPEILERVMISCKKI